MSNLFRLKKTLGLFCICVLGLINIAVADGSYAKNPLKCRPFVMIISAPSGTGKTTVMNGLMEKYPNIVKLASVTTRAPRHNETKGVDYKFINVKEYNKLLKKDRFFEHAEIYGNKYGVLRDDVENLLSSGHDVILDLDVKGANQFTKNSAGLVKVIKIYVMPPSIAELSRRLRGRGTDSEEVIKNRMSQVMTQLVGYEDYDYVITSTSKEAVIKDLQKIYNASFLKRTSCKRGNDRMQAIDGEYKKMK